MRKAKNMILIALYIALFAFGAVVLRGLMGKGNNPLTNEKKLYNEYVFPDRYMVWVSNDRKGSEWKQSYQLQNNKHVRVESGSKIIVLRKEGLGYLRTDDSGNQLEIAYSYKIKNGFITKVQNDTLNWYNGFNEKGISYVAESSTINRVRFREVFGGSVAKITEMKRIANRDVVQGKMTAEQSWLKTKDKVRRAMNSHSLIITNVAFVSMSDGKTAKYEEPYIHGDDDYAQNSGKYINQTYKYMPDDLKPVFEKIMADEPELDRRLAEKERKIQDEKNRSIERNEKVQNRKVGKKAFED